MAADNEKGYSIIFLSLPLYLMLMFVDNESSQKNERNFDLEIE
jgi:hypothetical protein